MKVLVTGSGGLIGGEVVDHFGSHGCTVYGLDNNARASYFGPDGDTTWNTHRLKAKLGNNFNPANVDITDYGEVMAVMAKVRPDVIVHAAAQPSHDLAASIPLVDFKVNALGTMHMLEATRKYAPEASFIYMSTNKVYGDNPNRLDVAENDLRWDYTNPYVLIGIDEKMSVDQCIHSVFGASKVAADVMVQEYGRYYGMNTCCLRGGCLTGPAHAGVELHGFLSYLVKCAVTKKPYTIYGYKGKQVRDNISASDVAMFIWMFAKNPRSGEVYNLGGGRANSCSILEAIETVKQLGFALDYSYVDQGRIGDHICYISDLTKMQTHYPKWHVSVPLDDIFEDLVSGWKGRV